MEQTALRRTPLASCDSDVGAQLGWYDCQRYPACMPAAKIAVSLDPEALKEIDRLVAGGLYPSRSSLVQEALSEKLRAMRRVRLARECAKLDPAREQATAEDGERDRVARVLRGDVLWADLDPVRGHEQAGHRPVVVLSEDVFNEVGNRLRRGGDQPGAEGRLSSDAGDPFRGATEAILGESQSDSDALDGTARLSTGSSGTRRNRADSPRPDGDPRRLTP